PRVLPFSWSWTISVRRLPEEVVERPHNAGLHAIGRARNLIRSMRLQLNERSGYVTTKIEDLRIIERTNTCVGAGRTVLVSRRHHASPGYGSDVRGDVGSCSSSDWRYCTQPRMNCGHSGTVGIGSVLSGSNPHNAG